MSKNKHILDKAVLPAPESNRYFQLLERHPYICSLLFCLLLNPLYFGSENGIPANALMLETVALLIIGFYLLWRLVRYQPHRRIPAAAAGIGFTVLVLLGAEQYRKAVHPGLWLMLGGCAILAGILWLTRKQAQNQRRRISLFLIGSSFFLRLFYVCYTLITRRQHDVGRFGDENNHAGYITYLLEHHCLPDFDPRDHWQFYHPPLHHAISAVWLWLSENVFGIGSEVAQESLQTLTLFYATAVIITAYRILRHFRLEGSALYFPLAVIAFHPSFILFSGSINNDVLSVAFLLGAVLWTLKWYEKQTWEGILKIALYMGLGMMTKLSVALAAFPIGAVFLVVLVRRCKAKNWRIFGQYGAFLGICAPLGLWYPIRNLVRFGVPLNYVQEMSVKSDQYLGDQSFLSRVLDFSPHQVAKVFEQWLHYDASGYTEYNPLITLLKNAVFGEYINQYTVDGQPLAFSLGVALFWTEVLLAAAAFAAMVWMFWRRHKTLGRLPGLFLAGFYGVLLFSFYQLAASAPFTCSMNYRYITPTCVIGAVFLGLAFQRLRQIEKPVCRWLYRIGYALCGGFAVFAALFYVKLGMIS